jgi:hypothetical protein
MRKVSDTSQSQQRNQGKKMKFNSLATITLLFLAITLTGCVSKLDSLEGKPFNEKNHEKVTKAFDKIEENMLPNQVLALLGKPHSIKTFKPAPTMKIPVKLNADTGREVWFYPGSGSITFVIDHHTRRHKVKTIFKPSMLK